MLGGCLAEGEPNLSETEGAVQLSNRLSSNRLSSNRLSSNRLSSNRLSSNSLEVMAMMDTDSGRDVLSYIVGCALPIGQDLVAKDSTGVEYTFPGWIGLAPAWATRAPTVSERRWVTACLLSRTNVNGVPVKISMRHDTNLALLTSATERATYTQAEGAFYGDLFAPVPVTYACSNRAWSPLVGTFRACALSPNGIATDCTFTYTGSCTKACGDKTAPFNGCKGLGTTYNEVATIFLTPTQQQGAEQ
ncbi:MAG: hypothetical protein IPQ07_38180 [Myxococcales bacterium]|nr:hypothetical protein [Myxococcales bacterium]